jgi:putative DNA primase/helicase
MRSGSTMADLRSLARALGGVVTGQQVLAPGPKHSASDRSLAVRPCSSAPDGFLVHSHAGDDWRECLDHVRARLGLPDWQPGDEQNRRVHETRVREFDRQAIDREAEYRPRTEDDLIRIQRAVAIWDEADDPRGTLAEEYLTKARKLELSDELAGHVLRFHPRCPWRNEDTGCTDRIPVLIAAFSSIDDDAITAIHRIRLDRPGLWPKVDRRMFGVVRRAAVKLGWFQGGELAIGEGVETAMAAQQLGLWPAWALGSTGNIAGFPVIGDIKQLTILGETGKASRDAIEFCAPRWRKAGRAVRIVMPSVGSDLNDELIKAAMP